MYILHSGAVRVTQVFNWLTTFTLLEIAAKISSASSSYVYSEIPGSLFFYSTQPYIKLGYAFMQDVINHESH